MIKCYHPYTTFKEDTNMEKEVMNFIKEEEDFWEFAKECWKHGDLFVKTHTSLRYSGAVLCTYYPDEFCIDEVIDRENTGRELTEYLDDIIPEMEFFIKKLTEYAKANALAMVKSTGSDGRSTPGGVVKKFSIILERLKDLQKDIHDGKVEYGSHYVIMVPSINEYKRDLKDVLECHPMSYRYQILKLEIDETAISEFRLKKNGKIEYKDNTSKRGGICLKVTNTLNGIVDFEVNRTFPDYPNYEIPFNVLSAHPYESIRYYSCKNINIKSSFPTSYRYFVCKECGKLFFLKDTEISWFKEKGFPIPKRCKHCRDKRKQMKETNE